MVIGTYILIITLNVNGLNAPTKKHKMAEWIKKIIESSKGKTTNNIQGNSHNVNS